jgi:hypothetical protein
MRPRFISPLLLLALTAGAAGCFYPPMAKPLPPAKTSTIVKLPYDLAWDAVNSVIRQERLKVQVQDPNHGLIEAQGGSFSLQDADCGRIRSVGTYAATPEPDATSVYNFQVTAVGNEASRVEIRATFDSPLKVPLRQPQDIECISRGTQESRLLRLVLAQATHTRPPSYRKPEEPAPTAEPAPAPPLPGRPTLLKPGVLPEPKLQ